MDGRRFDALARHLAAVGTSRRRFLRTLGGGLAASIGVAAAGDSAGAVICRAGGALCAKGSQCCSGTCDPDTHRCGCFDGEILCRGRCIPDCTASDECHVAGICDPSRGACTNPPADNGTTCGQGPRCTNGVANEQDSCDGSGSCTTGETTECTPYVCGATACLTSCGGNDSACINGYYCASNQCLPQQQAGSSCTGGNQCETGNCVDGVCCDTACTNQCAACNLPGNAGTCSAVTGSPVGGRPSCASDGSLCGGICDGTDTPSCSYPTTQCRAASCTNGTETLAASCDGAGVCPGTQTQSCGSYICGTDACFTTCDDDNQCIDAAYCDTITHTCKQDLPNGQPCSRDHQCTSRDCVDGYCCDHACTGQCEACDVINFLGTCHAVTGSPHGSRSTCTGAGTTCGGTCDGTNPTSCAYPGAGTTCRAASCSAGQATSAATCNGTGTCPASTVTACAPYVCGSTTCLTSCATNASCSSGYSCGDDNQCHQQLPNGGTCSTSNQCQNGHCVGGVCCDTACTGPNQACCGGTCTDLTTDAHCGACDTTCPHPCNGFTGPSCRHDIDGQYFCGANGYCTECAKDGDCPTGYRCIVIQPGFGCEKTTFCISPC